MLSKTDLSLIILIESLRQDGKLVGRIRIVERLENVFERLIVNNKIGRQPVGRFRLAFFGAEMKKAGVVTVVGFFKKFPQTAIGIVAIADTAQSALVFNTTVFGNT